MEIHLLSEVSITDGAEAMAGLSTLVLFETQHSMDDAVLELVV